MKVKCDAINFVDISSCSKEVLSRLRIWRNSDFVRKGMLNQHVISPEEHQEWLKKISLKDKKDKFWVIFIEEASVGAIYLSEINYEDKKSKWGFYIGEDEYRGKGWGGHILQKFLECYFKDLCFDVLITEVLEDNMPALRIYQNCGLEEIDKYKLQDGRKVVVFSFTKEQWQNGREANHDSE